MFDWLNAIWNRSTVTVAGNQPSLCLLFKFWPTLMVDHACDFGFLSIWTNKKTRIGCEMAIGLVGRKGGQWIIIVCKTADKLWKDPVFPGSNTFSMTHWHNAHLMEKYTKDAHHNYSNFKFEIQSNWLIIRSHKWKRGKFAWQIQVLNIHIFFAN